MLDRTHGLAGVLVGLLMISLASCSRTPAPSSTPVGDCPVGPVEVVVSVAQWSDIAVRLGGDCAHVTTIVGSTVSDPHEFEPTPSDIARFSSARIVVLNGLGYDEWARRAVGLTGDRPTIVDAGRIAGRRTGDNPHVWYAPEVVRATADAVTAALIGSAPAARQYLEQRHADWIRSLEPYDAEIARIRAGAAGRTYAATEPVFDDMAAAVGLRDVTPAGYRRASLNESEPSPVDVADFLDAIDHHVADVLVLNTQTEGALTRQLRDAALRAGTPVVPVTETVPVGARSFVDWQLGQLRSLARALGV